MSELKRFFPILAAVAVLILIQQAADLSSGLPAIDFATPSGRMRQLMATAARSPAALTADFLLILAILGGGWNGWLRPLGIMHVAIAGLCFLALPFFLADAGRVASTFSGPQVTSYRLLVIRTLVLLPTLGIIGILVGRSLLVRSRQPASAA